MPTPEPTTDAAEQAANEQAQTPPAAPATDNTTYDLDLDTLVKPSKVIKLGGEPITINPPQLEELLKLSKLGGAIQKRQSGEKMSEEEAVEAINNLRAAFVDLIPELKGKQLNVEQLLALLDLVVAMAMPSDVSELEKRGITLDADQKKILQGLSNK